MSAGRVYAGGYDLFEVFLRNRLIGKFRRGTNFRQNFDRIFSPVLGALNGRERTQTERAASDADNSFTSVHNYSPVVSKNEKF